MYQLVNIAIISETVKLEGLPSGQGLNTDIEDKVEIFYYGNPDKSQISSEIIIELKLIEQGTESILTTASFKYQFVFQIENYSSKIEDNKMSPDLKKIVNAITYDTSRGFIYKATMSSLFFGYILPNNENQ